MNKTLEATEVTVRYRGAGFLAAPVPGRDRLRERRNQRKALASVSQ
jgi:hypothetical protein